MSTVGEFEIRDVATIRDGILRIIRNGLIDLGVENPNVSPNSSYYIEATALANECTVAEANAVIKVDAFMPDTATGDELLRWLTSVGLAFRSAVGSVGKCTMVSNPAGGSVSVTAGDQLIDDAGLFFEVVTTGTYDDGDLFDVAGVSTGFATNHINGDVLTWVATPAFAAPTVTVGMVGGTDGLIDGVDDEDEETARARLLDRLANPPSGFNWEHVAEIAEAASPTVQKAFVYPALEGPSSLQVVVAGFATSFLSIAGPSAARAIDATIVTNTIQTYVRGILPSSINVTVLTTDDIPADVAVGLSLPAAPTASPAGPGGGWLDGTPWPSAGSASAYASVGTVTSSTVFEIDALTAPIDGVSRIAYIRQSNWRIYSAKVVSHTGTGPYVVAVDTPMTGITNGDFVWPQCAQQQAYITALLKAFSQMGPGEKTTSPGRLERAFRHPTPAPLWPYSLGGQQLRAIEDVGDEVLDTQWLYRSLTTPPVPVPTADKPAIFIAGRIGLYPI
jgi:uncharacterized phage protein gp47/JayE